MYDKVEKNWLVVYQELKEYYLEHGNYKIPDNYVTKNGVKLQKWLSKQKDLYHEDKLAMGKIILLEQINVSFGYLDFMWNRYYNSLKKYINENPQLKVNNYTVSSNGLQIGKWYFEQLAAYRNHILNRRQIKLFKEIDYKYISLKNDSWDEHYYQLEDYFKKYGNINIKTEYVTEDGVKIGKWLFSQKASYLGNSNVTISRNHIMLLNDLFIDWSTNDTKKLNSKINDSNKELYKKVMLKRMRHILDDLSYEINGDISDLDKQKEIEKIIIKRMWR